MDSIEKSHEEGLEDRTVEESVSLSFLDSVEEVPDPDEEDKHHSIDEDGEDVSNSSDEVTHFTYKPVVSSTFGYEENPLPSDGTDVVEEVKKENYHRYRLRPNRQVYY